MLLPRTLGASFGTELEILWLVTTYPGLQKCTSFSVDSLHVWDLTVNSQVDGGSNSTRPVHAAV